MSTVDYRIWKKLFSEPYRAKIQKILPTLFNIVELENRKGGKLGMEVGSARERVLIALFIYAYGKEEVEFPPATSPELDVIVCGNKVSIKTKSGKGYTGIKLFWAADWDRKIQFIKNFVPGSDLLYVNVIWNEQGTFMLIPKKVQQDIHQTLSRNFFNMLKKDTNNRGVELSKEAMLRLQEHPDTLSLSISWMRDTSLLAERVPYYRWVELWDSLV